MDDQFDFQIIGNVRELERLIRARAGEEATPDSADEAFTRA